MLKLHFYKKQKNQLVPVGFFAFFEELKLTFLTLSLNSQFSILTDLILISSAGLSAMPVFAFEIASTIS